VNPGTGVNAGIFETEKKTCTGDITFIQGTL
jgi:hypothetical protein